MRLRLCTSSVILASLYVGGCHQPDAPVNPYKDQQMGTMDSNQLLLLSEGRIPSFQSGYVWTNLSEMYDTKFVHLLDYNLKGNKGFRLQEHVKDGLAIKVAYLRNPGALYFVIHLKGGRPLKASDQPFLEALAKKQGLTVLKDGTIPFKFGPDGRTPIVMKWEGTYEGFGENNNIVDGDATLSFPSQKDAVSAAEYFDKLHYTPKVKGSDLKVAFRVPLGRVGDEGIEFDRVASQLGGKRTSLGSTDQTADSQNQP